MPQPDATEDPRQGSITLRSHAKINWWLRVLDRRADGYHSIETVFQRLDLHDDVLVEALPESGQVGGPICHIEGFPRGWRWPTI